MAGAAVALAGPARRLAVRLVAGAAVCTLVYFELLASSAARQRATEFAGSESTGRLDLWHVALRMFDAHPLHGVGLDNFTVLAPGYLANDIDIQRADLFLRSVATQVHNTYLTVLVELGLIGELLFVSFLVAVVAARALRVLARSGDRDAELLGRGLVVGVVGMLTAYVFFSAQYEKQLWLLLGALLALATTARATGSSDATPR
jgi:O-antigen ligase